MLRMSDRLQRVASELLGRMPQRARNGLFVIAGTIVTVALMPHVARAEDLTGIQAVVTADLNANRMTNRGVFRLLRLVRSAPYAYLIVEFGLKGFGGGSYFLLESSGRWSIVARGKPMLGVSELRDFGVPPAQADLLVGANCPPSWFLSAKADQLAVRGARPGKYAWRRIVPAQPPTQIVTVTLKGERLPVRITRSRDVKVCSP